MYETLRHRAPRELCNDLALPMQSDLFPFVLSHTVPEAGPAQGSNSHANCQLSLDRGALQGVLLPSVSVRYTMKPTAAHLDLEVSEAADDSLVQCCLLGAAMEAPTTTLWTPC